MGKDVLLEIGTEEIPASYIEPARAQLRALAQQMLGEHRLRFEKLATYATPCRLALYIEKIEDKSEDRVEEMTGPALKAARDAGGNFTPAARGFAAKHGVPVEKLESKMMDRGEYLCVRRKLPGERADRILAAVLPALIGKLSFPKTMVWEPSRFRFARPIRSIVALHGEKVIKFAVAGVKSANGTRGLHTISRKKVVIGSPERYCTALRNNCVIADPVERRDIITKIVDAAAKRAKGAVLADEALVEEINYLVEHPVAVLCRFEERYLSLPKEVLITCLRRKQKCFAVAGAGGELTNYFIGIRNGISENQDVVREGYERVVAARLADAAFFFEQDRHTALAEKYPKLAGVNFQEKLGTVHDKMERVKRLALVINEASYRLDHAAVTAAAALAKADLVTSMVFEYPELQGVMGRIYAAADGEPAEVSRAVEEHYLPLAADGKLPETHLGTVLSLADKLDTLVGDFAVGLIPTGSADPYGLRRMGTGVIRMLVERELSFSLAATLERSLSFFPEPIRAAAVPVPAQVLEFLKQRFENFSEGKGYKFDEIRAVVAVGFDNAVDARARLDTLHDMRRREDFAALAAAFKRASNILKQAERAKITVPDGVREDLFREEAERRLFAGVRTIAADVQAMLERHDYRGALQTMVSIKPSVDEFFEKVMVMADDEAKRGNRLALLQYIARLFFRILDFSQLQS